MTLLSALSSLHTAIAAASVTHHATTSMAERIGAVEEARLALLAAHRAEVAEATARERAAVLSVVDGEALALRACGVAGETVAEMFVDLAGRIRTDARRRDGNTAGGAGEGER